MPSPSPALPADSAGRLSRMLKKSASMKKVEVQAKVEKKRV
jgi:hypothetical protein